MSRLPLLVLRRENPYAQVVVPDHRELDRGTLRGIIRQAWLTVEEFVALL
jgi:predicted RNA binding protein YcfA (HicA-like mRNA interferase family)